MKAIAINVIVIVRVLEFAVIRQEKKKEKRKKITDTERAVIQSIVERCLYKRSTSSQHNDALKRST